MSEQQTNDAVVPERAEPEVRSEGSVAPEPSIEAKAASDVAPAPASETPVEAAAVSREGVASRASLRPVAQAAALAVAAGLGWIAGSGNFLAAKPHADPAQEALLRVDWTELASTIQKSQAETTRLASDMLLLRTGLGTLRETIDRSKQDIATRFGGLTERLDKAQRTEQDMTAKVASVLERLDRPERDITAKLGPAIDARLGPVSERLDRIERQGVAIANTVAGANTAAPAFKQMAPAEPTQTATIPDKAKAPVLQGWILRDVYKGMALLEGRNQRLVEITAGQNLPGVGRIEAIERRGKAWVVVTAKGIITSQEW